MTDEIDGADGGGGKWGNDRCMVNMLRILYIEYE